MHHFFIKKLISMQDILQYSDAIELTMSIFILLSSSYTNKFELFIILKISIIIIYTYNFFHW